MNKTLTSRLFGPKAWAALAAFAAVTLVLVPILNLVVPETSALHLSTYWVTLTGTISGGGTLCGVAVGSGAFTGSGHFAWSPYQVDLSAYAGQTVKLRWLYRSDQATNGEGWFVDDVALTHAQVPGMCLADGERIFVDGFDAAP